MKRLKTVYRMSVAGTTARLGSLSHLNSSHVGVLGCVLILVQTVLGEFALSQIDAEFDKEDHDGLEGGDGAVAGALRGDMFVQELEGSLLLLDSDEFLGTFAEGGVNSRSIDMDMFLVGRTEYSRACCAVVEPCWAD
jgi:hypothetical protein